jgi:hypothetical protein
MSNAGLPPDRPGEALPNFGAGTPSAHPAPPPPPPVQTTPLPPQQQPPVFVAAAVQQPYYGPPGTMPPSTGMSTGAKVGLGFGIGCLALIVIGVLITVIAIVIAASLPTEPTYSDYPIYSDDDALSPDDEVVSGASETEWKSGANWLTPPAGDPLPGRFSSSYATPEEFLRYAMGATYDFEVVFTADPAYNCGMSKATPEPNWVIGCYNPEYGQTIFIWWGEQADPDMKTLILLHEYSHYWQNYYYYDAVQSAAAAGLFDDSSFIDDVWEIDATCRIYEDWHWRDLKYLDDYTLSPCGDTAWGPRWLENELLERGVKITDY